MNLISDILYWISTGLLVPVIVLLIILFCRAIILAGSFYGQYLSIRKTPDPLSLCICAKYWMRVILRHRYNAY